MRGWVSCSKEGWDLVKELTDSGLVCPGDCQTRDWRDMYI